MDDGHIAQHVPDARCQRGFCKIFAGAAKHRCRR